MKKLLTMVAVAGVAAVATADLANFQFIGASLDLGAAPATHADTAVVVIGDQTQLVVGGEIDINDIIPIWQTGDLTVKPPFAGGGYQSSIFSERPFLAGGDFADTLATLIYDANGGGIAEGDVIGLYTFNITDTTDAGQPPSTTIQQVSNDNLVGNITVIPEPATFGLMGIAGLGMFLARKKARS